MTAELGAPRQGPAPTRATAFRRNVLRRPTRRGHPRRRAGGSAFSLQRYKEDRLKADSGNDTSGGVKGRVANLGRGVCEPRKDVGGMRVFDNPAGWVNPIG